MNIETIRPYKSEMIEQLKTVGIIYANIPTLEHIAFDYMKFYLHDKQFQDVNYENKDNFIGALIGAAVSGISAIFGGRKKRKAQRARDNENRKAQNAAAKAQREYEERMRKLAQAKSNYIIAEQNLKEVNKKKRTKQYIFFGSFLLPLILIYIIFLK